MAKPKLIAHRGYPQYLPENTIVGIGAAIEAGARYIEIDIQLTADQEPVLFHDRDLKRMCGSKGSIHDYTLHQLRSLRASEPERFGDAFKHIRIATLMELIELLSHHPKVKLFVEIKRIAIKKFGATTILSQLHRMLKPIRKRCTLISFDYEFLLVAHRNNWEPLGPVIENWSDRNNKIINEIKPKFLFCDYKILPRYKSIRKGDSRLAVYEVADPDLALRLFNQGVDYIETFAIEEMLQELKDRS